MSNKSSNNNHSSNTFAYKKEESLVFNLPDDFAFSINEYYRLYSFFVTYSLYDKTNVRNRNYEDYGWRKGNSPFKSKEIKPIIDLDCSRFSIVVNDIKKHFIDLDLFDKTTMAFDDERFVIAGGDSNSSKNELLFKKIRNCFAHGKYLLKYSSTKEKMVVFQDNDNHNVNARIVLKLKTLLDIISFIDKAELI